MKPDEGYIMYIQNPKCGASSNKYISRRFTDYLAEKGYDSFGGTYNYRLMKGGSMLTTHAWCIAIDMNPHLGPYRQRDGNGQWINNQPEFITEAFRKRGFTTFPWDMRHFQAVVSSSKSAVCYWDVIQKINENEAG